MNRKANNVLRIKLRPIIEFEKDELLPIPKGFTARTE
jgi:hypothetical protein